MGSDSGTTFTANNALGYLLGKDAWDEEQDWLEERKKETDKPHHVPDYEKIQSNLKALGLAASHLKRQLEREGAQKIYVTSGLRPPRRNHAVGGQYASRHQAGLAMDVQVYTTDGRIPAERVAKIAQLIPSTEVRFEKAVVYDDFTHFALARGEPQEYDGPTEIYYTNDNEPTRPAAGGTFVPDDLDDGEVSVTVATSDDISEATHSLQERLGVRQKENYDGQDASYERTESGNLKELDDREPPRDGEIDLGDLRFGSVKFEEREEADLNQPTAINQQNAGAVATPQMLRTDMNPVIADNKALPEMVITISLNATRRDDVNNRLRPLVAMQRRLPFCAARNPDLARMMLGISASEDIEGRLQEVYENLGDDQVEQMAEGLPENLGSIWVPITLRQISVDTQPGSAGLYQVHVIMRFANIMPYVPEMRFWKDTKSSIEWARYLSLRSMQGAQVQSTPTQASDEVTIITPRDKVITAEPPADMAGMQTDSPHKSYPFKKMYLGLLEEFLPDQSGGVYDTRKEEVGDPAEKGLKPIGYSDGEPVYEPGYPISDPGRVMEVYDSSSPIGLEYVTANMGNTPEARMQRVLSAFQEQINLADQLDAAIGTAGLTDDNVRGLEEAGKITPVIVGPGRQMGKIMLSVGQTADAFEKVTSEVFRKMEGDPVDDIVGSVKQFGVEFDQENMRIKSEAYDAEATDAGTAVESRRKHLALLRGDLAHHEMARDMMSTTGLFEEGGVANFQVPDRQYEDVFVNFDDRFGELQKGILVTYIQLVEQMERDARWEDLKRFGVSMGGGGPGRVGIGGESVPESVWRGLPELFSGKRAHSELVLRKTGLLPTRPNRQNF